jgi:CRISPR-associated endonuclease/helicase Cas3
MSEDFSKFFHLATGGKSSYPFQGEFATADPLPHLLRAPTGAGKTATAIIGWLWRLLHSGKSTPRRLIYCLPMRVLVEQSVREARQWIENLKLGISVHVLMGGVDAEQWYLEPAKPAIIIGTQDMLLSRALNRGYAASRFHWPIDFALLNNDCLWIFDEPQLMASGVSTSAQLSGLRQKLGGHGDCPSVWMSATLEPSWLDTIDFRGQFTGKPLELTIADYDPNMPLYERMTAEKTLHKLDAAPTDIKGVSKTIFERHESGTQTLVIVNTVDRAKAVYDELVRLRKKNTMPALLLVHSRFRPPEREELNFKLQQKVAGDRIIVATQVVEAGVDISSRTLFTELAPWASIVQRIGRCNRTGKDGPGVVHWIDLDDKSAPPYSKEDLDFARDQLTKLADKDVSPKSLDDFKRDEKITLPFEHKHVLRRRDLLDLFDTAPDLSGNDIDIQRFVRSDDPDTDVQVFWREFSRLPGDQLSPERRELCSVPIGQMKKFVELLKKKKRGDAFYWDHLDDNWVKLDPKQTRPGLVIMLASTAGGYSELGWDLNSTTPVTPYRPKNELSEEATGSDPESTIPVALTVQQHTQNVCAMLEELIEALSLSDFADILRTSARWHDVGKTHVSFQNAMRKLNNSLAADQLWAKSGKKGRLVFRPPYFRHELASALAALQRGLPFEAAYLIAAHHGKVRLNIRSLPNEKPPEELFALGVRHGDELPVVDLGGVVCPTIKLDLSPMRLGGDHSWTGRALQLLADLGPFRLAYLEAMLRIADVRASRKEAGNA